MKLLESQSKATEKLREWRVGALFMEAGSGKTRALIELVSKIESPNVFWFTPCQTIENLRSEIEKWSPKMSLQIIGIESISQSDRIYLEVLRKIQYYDNVVMVVDESLKIKNSDAKRTQRILEMGGYADYRYILNGTPLSRNLLDLKTQIDFLSPKILRMSDAEFKNTFCEYVKITYNSPNSGTRYSREFIKKYHNIPYLYSLIKPYIYESKLSLGVGVQHIDIGFHVSDGEKKEHDLLKEKYLDNDMLMAKNNNIFLELTQKMQQNYSLSKDKFRAVDELLTDIKPNKVLIYSKYVKTQEELKKYYKGIKIMSYGKHSYGLNLQDYNIVIFWDKTWDYAQREQAEHRVYRTGQSEDCIYYDLTANLGLDNLINNCINKKQDLLNIFKKIAKDEL